MLIRFVLTYLAITFSALCNAAPDGGRSQATSLEEVIVTARKRDENIQNTPVAVSAFSAADLFDQGIFSAKDLSKIVPSLHINKGAVNQVFIRGVGQRSGFARVDPPVGVYLDDIYLPRVEGQLLDTVDIESMQVLRGPQGTLFGKNNTGGAIVTTLVKPDDEFSAYVDASMGNYGMQRVVMGLNQPLTENLFTSLAVSSLRNTGYIDDVSHRSPNSQDDRKALVSQLRWLPNEDITLDGLFYYGKTRQKLPPIHCSLINRDALLNERLGFLWEGDTDPLNPQAFSESCLDNSTERLPDLTTNFGAAGKVLNEDIDTALLGITAQWNYRENHSTKLVVGLRQSERGPYISNYGDGGPLHISESRQIESSNSNSTSIELQFSGSYFESALSYTAGLFALNEDNDENTYFTTALTGVTGDSFAALVGTQLGISAPTAGVPAAPLIGPLAADFAALGDFRLNNTTLAAFSQLTWSIVEQFELTLGLRYTVETRDTDLFTTRADRQAIADIIGAHPFFSPSDPELGGLHVYNGPGGWADDPIGIAVGLFPDANGDGAPEVAMDFANTRYETRSDDFKQITPMVSATLFAPDSWLLKNPLDSLMAYATWSTGFKSGFFEPKGVDGLQRIEPETVENMEIGFKLEAFERSLRLNIALYQMIFEDQQLIQVGLDSGGTIVGFFTNAGQAVIEGGELELSWLPIDGLLINLSYSNNNYKYDEFDEFDLFDLIVGTQTPVDRSDENFPVSPEKTAALGIQYEWIIESMGTIVPRLDVSYKDETYQGFDRGSWTESRDDKDIAYAPAYTLVDARLSWTNEKGDLTVSGFINNLTDKRYLIGSVAIYDSIGIFQQMTGIPRTWGFGIRKTYQ